MTGEIHPAPIEFTMDQISDFPILRFFHYAHLPESLQARSKPFCELAMQMYMVTDTTGSGREEFAAGLRKLLEAKDAFVRAGV